MERPSPYIISSGKDNTVECAVEMAIVAPYTSYSTRLFMMSICDITIRVKKVCADILSANRADLPYEKRVTQTLKDRKDPNVNIDVYVNSAGYKYKITQVDSTYSHAIIYRDNNSIAIDWNGIGIVKLLTRHIRQKMHMPVTEEIVRKMICAQESIADGHQMYNKLSVLSASERFDRLEAYSINSEYFNEYLANVRINPNKAEYDWASIRTIEDYIMRFIEPIKTRLHESVSVLYDQDKISPYIFDLKRPPYAGQVPIIQSGLEVLKASRDFFMGAEQGMGKTTMAIAVARAYFKERNNDNYNCLLLVPAITIKQWEKELKECYPEKITTYVIRSTSDFIRLYDTVFTTPAGPSFFIVGKETFKLSYQRKPAYVVRTRNVTEQYVAGKYDEWHRYRETVETRTVSMSVLTCPHCDAILENKQRRETTYLTEADFSKPKKSNSKCENCGTPLWAATYDKTKKTSLIDFIQRKGIMFDMGFVDEIQDASNSDSIIGTATRSVIRHFRKGIYTTGTSNNGYTSSLFNVLMGMKSRSLIADKVGNVDDFVKNYGSLKSVIKQSDPNYRLSGKIEVKDTQTREIEGINPVVFAKYLSSTYLFATISELTDQKHLLPLVTSVSKKYGVNLEIKKLPALSEEYVPVMHDCEMSSYESGLFSDMKEINAQMASMMVGSIIRHYTNNPFKWNSIAIRGKEGIEYVEPQCIPDNVPLKKEEKLIELCQEQKKRGRAVWIYTEFTGDGTTSQYMTGTPIPLRLKSILEKAGFTVFWLRPSVSPIDRKDLIDRNKDVYDVFISNPKLVQVGINMEWCPSYIFYMPSYEVNVIDQACRRGYRANSEFNNEIFYLYYENSKEKEIVERMQLKKAESKAIEAKFDITLHVGRTASAFSARIDGAIKLTEEVQNDGNAGCIPGAETSEASDGGNVIEPLKFAYKLRDSKKVIKKKILVDVGEYTEVIYAQLELAF